jgi:hypothetical protein
MNTTPYLYAFVGCVTALRYYVQQSTAPDKDVALEACNRLREASKYILSHAGQDDSLKTFKDLLSMRAIPVTEATQTLKGTTAYQEFNATIIALKGGGDPTSNWPNSLSPFKP